MKKQTIYMLVVCCLVLCGFTACGRDNGNSNNNSVTDGTYGEKTPTPTNTPTVVPNNNNNYNEPHLNTNGYTDNEYDQINYLYYLFNDIVSKFNCGRY